ncbi:MAG: amino acid adenylation domain-containing protein [Rhodococcus sp. (in: high G+C Gram-positive bacteria)]
MQGGTVGLGDEHADYCHGSLTADVGGLADAVKRSAFRNPSGTALRSGNTTVSYSEMLSAAASLADSLRYAGIERGDVVGVNIERSVDMVICMLAAVYAGAAYLPLDPSNPHARIVSALDAVEATAVFSRQPLGAEGRIEITNVDRLGLTSTTTAYHEPPTASGARDLACVMLTSGSSGTPKAVMVEHGSILRIVEHDARWAIDPDDVVAHMASTSFDAATLEIWGALVAGATLAIPPQPVGTASELASFFAHHDVSVAWLTAGLFHEVVDDDPSPLGRLRCLMTGGDVVSPVRWDRIHAEYPNVLLVNGYGPTENTVFTTTYTGPTRAGTVPIGTSVGGSTVDVLDAALHSVRAGGVGELYTGGTGVARGYHASPGVTAARFVADPRGNGGRVYRTGDLVRVASDGNLDYVGREDDQVKLRGYRVEPGEIQARLAEIPGVATSYVLCDRSSGSARLIAYVVPDTRSNQPVTVDYLRHSLRSRLPSPLIPSSFVLLDRLPLGTTGKVDRRALPVDVPVTSQTARAHLDGTEDEVARLFLGILGYPIDEPTTSFFDFGGDSLQAMRLLAAVRRTLSVDVSFADFLDGSSVRALAATIDASSPTDVSEIRVAPDRERWELSGVQQRFWFSEVLNPGSRQHHCPRRFAVTGTFSVEAFTRALEHLTVEHPILRTAVDVSTGSPWAVVRPAARGEDLVSSVNLEFVPPDRRNDAADAALDAFSRAPFDLRSGRVIRCMVVRLASEEHIIFLEAHHIAIDGWSFGILDRDLGRLYDDALRGLEFPAPDAEKIGYAEYSLWQRGRDSGLEYWSERLDGLEPLSLPTDHPRPPTRSTEGSAVRRHLDVDLLTALERTTKHYNGTLFITLTSLVHILLSRYTGNTDVTVGAVVAGRDSTEFESVLGCFVNTVALRSDVNEDLSVLDFLAQQRTSITSDLAHSHARFERVVTALVHERDPSTTPLVQAAVVLQNTPSAGLRLAGGIVDELPLERHSAQFDVTFEFETNATGLELILEYDTALFEASTIEQMAARFEAMARASTDHYRPVAELPFIFDDELCLVTETWNDTAREFSDTRPVHVQVIDQARRTPDRIALRDSTSLLTYNELERRSRSLAHALHDAGARPGDSIPLAVSPGVEFVVAMLAVARFGGVYVPLDIKSPPTRLESIAREVSARIVVTDSPSLGDERWAGIHTVTTTSTESPGHYAAPPDVDSAPTDPVYTVFTSGSSGRPKGVRIEHRSLANLCAWARDEFGLDGTSVVAQTVNTAFDPLSYEVWPALTAGGCVAIPSARDLEDPIALVDWIARMHVTDTVVVTARVDSVFDELDRVGTSLRTVLIGGDVLRRRPSPEWDFRVYNAYGPTESTVIATAGRVEPSSVADSSDLPTIGRPLPNTVTYVLDRRGRPVPPGVPGELYLGGIQISSGYVREHSPETSPFGTAAEIFGTGSHRIYRTGDIVEWTRRGELAFVGRADRQVKIRGHRVEPAEVTVALTSLDGVTDAYVQAKLSARGTTYLLAHVVASGRSVDAAQLSSRLAETHPAYLVPDKIVVLGAFPLTPRHKIDVAALPVPDDAGPVGTPPTTASQIRLAEVWRSVLGIDQVGIEDNFFALGGDSIVAMTLVASARRAGFTFTARDLFRSSTIEALADFTHPEAAGPVGADIGAVPVGPIAHLYYREVPSGLAFDQSVVIELESGVNVDALRRAITEIVAHHAALRMRVTRMAGSLEQHIPDVDLPFETTVLTGVSGRDTTDVVAALRTAPRPLSGALFAATLVLETAGRAAQLVLVGHHLVIDAVSWRILLDDLDTAYGQLTTSRAVDLGHPTTPVRRWTQVLLTDNASRFEADRAAWRSTVATPWTLPRSAGPSIGTGLVRDERTVHRSLDPRSTRIVTASVAYGSTIEIVDVLLAALGRVLARRAGTSRVVLAMEGHGRDESLSSGTDLSRTVGWLTDYYPFALDVQDGDWDDRLESVHRQRTAAPHTSGYGVLVAHDGPSGQLSRYGRPEVSFNYLGRFENVRIGGKLITGVSSIELNQDSRSPRLHVLDIVGVQRDGELRFDWTYSPHAHELGDIESLADGLIAELRSFADVNDSDENNPAALISPHAGVAEHSLNRVLPGVADIDDAYPLTPMQQGLIFHSLVSADRRAYLEQISIDISGIADVTNLAKAWQRASENFEVLRTRFVLENVPHPLQVVDRATVVPVESVDWSLLDESGLSDARRRFVAADAARGLELTDSPVMRVTVADRGRKSVTLFWTFHHALLDGWSGMQVLGEVLAEYAALRDGTHHRPRARAPFRTYVEWLLRQDSSAAKAFWTRRLAGLHAPTALPFDRPRRSGHRGISDGSVSVTLSVEQSGALRSTVRTDRVTLNTAFQAMWALLLHRYTGDSDICFGATTSGRPARLADADTIVGLFLNAVPVRVDVDESAQVQQWIGGIQNDSIDALVLDHVSLPDIRSWSEVESGASLFDSILVFENYPIDPEMGTRHGLSIESVTGHSGTNYPLNVVAYPEEQFRILLRYDSALFDRATVERIGMHFRSLLESYASGVDSLSDLKMVSGAERSLLLDEWSGRGTRAAPSERVHKAIERIALNNGDRIALEDSANRTATYRELWDRSEKLATRLRTYGVGRGTLVAVAVPRSVDAVVATLAVLIAGAAYVPIETRAPAQRVSAVLEATDPVAVLVTPETDLDPLRGYLTLFMADTSLGSTPLSATPTTSGPDDLAYVVFTSGTTGRPKGVMVQHGGLRCVVGSVAELYDLRPDTRVHHVCSLAFDGGIQDLFAALVSGSRLTLDDADAEDSLSNRLRASGANVVSLPASLVAAVNGDLPDLRIVGSGGDTLPASAVEAQQGRQLINLYGPSETTILATTHQAPPSGGGRLPLGTPISGARTYVLDQQLRPVAIGVTGELYIGGIGVSRGYLGQSATTSARFVADPFGDAGSRLYRTGDLIMWTPLGELDFAGRSDHQVKIRGFRVETTGVQHVLDGHGLVVESLVTATHPAGNERQLTAYVQQKPGAALTREDVRAYVRAVLPEYMVPTAVVLLDSFPLTTNGKVDRARLPDPTRNDVVSGVYRAPSSPTESSIAEVWRELLGVAQVGADDDYVALGGDSILSLRMSSRLSTTFAVELTPRDIFDSPTIALLSDRIQDLILLELEQQAGLPSYPESR